MRKAGDREKQSKGIAKKVITLVKQVHEFCAIDETGNVPEFTFDNQAKAALVAVSLIAELVLGARRENAENEE
jgi:hypothetical protein